MNILLFNKYNITFEILNIYSRGVSVISIRRLNIPKIYCAKVL